MASSLSNPNSVPSRSERDYLDLLANLFRQHGWRVRKKKHSRLPGVGLPRCSRPRRRSDCRHHAGLARREFPSGLRRCPGRGDPPSRTCTDLRGETLMACGSARRSRTNACIHIGIAGKPLFRSSRIRGPLSGVVRIRLRRIMISFRSVGIRSFNQYSACTTRMAGRPAQ